MRSCGMLVAGITGGWIASMYNHGTLKLPQVSLSEYGIFETFGVGFLIGAAVTLIGCVFFAEAFYLFRANVIKFLYALSFR